MLTRLAKKHDFGFLIRDGAGQFTAPFDTVLAGSAHTGDFASERPTATVPQPEHRVGQPARPDGDGADVYSLANPVNEHPIHNETRSSNHARRKHRRASVAVLVATIAMISGLVWANRTYIDSAFSNRIGEPERTGPATPIDAQDPPSARLAVAGDVGTGGAEQYRTSRVMDALDEQYAYDALLLLGDNVYESGDPEMVDDKVLDPFAPVLDTPTQLLAVLGNHDIRDGNGPAHAIALGMKDIWYSTALDDTLIVALDSNQPDNADQLAWLDETLSTSTARWTIAIMHHPAFSAGWHGSEPGVQEHFVPLFEAHGIDLVLSGHDHDYQRSERINGVTYVVTGAAAKLRDTGRDSFTAVSWSTYSFVDLAVYADRIEGQAIDHDGRTIDQFSIGPSGD